MTVSNISGKSMNRRTFGKAATVGIASGLAASQTFAAPHLNLNRQAGEITLMYNYVPFMEDVLPQFEEETGIKITSAEAYNNDEDWWAKINAGVKTDFLIGGTDWIQRVLAADLGMPLDLSQLSNLDTLYPDFREADYYKKDGKSYAVPFTRVYYSMTYNTDEFREAPSSWGVTWDETYSGRISVMDQAYARIGTTALYLGQDPLNPDDWDAIEDALLEQKPLVDKYWHDFQNGMEMFMNEAATVGQLTAGRTRMAMSQDAPINWTVPEEGCLTFIDAFFIPETAEHVDEAHQLIDFLIRPDIMAKEMTMMYYDTLNEAAREELPDDVKESFELSGDPHLVLTTDINPEIRSRMDEMWTEVKLA